MNSQQGQPGSHEAGRARTGQPGSGRAGRRPRSGTEDPAAASTGGPRGPRKDQPAASGQQMQAGQAATTATVPGVPADGAATDIAVIKALAAPIRLRILYALTRSGGEARVMSAKELAEELGEPQTKLYRHLKMMESAGLIEVAETRLVSGILEQRYRAFEREYVIGRGPRTAARTSVEESAVTSVMRFFAESLFAARREGRIPPGDAADSGPHPKSLLAFSDRKVPASKAAELRRKLAEVADELTGPDDPDGVDVFTLIGFYSPAEPGSYPAESAPDPK